MHAKYVEAAFFLRLHLLCIPYAPTHVCVCVCFPPLTHTLTRLILAQRRSHGEG